MENPSKATNQLRNLILNRSANCFIVAGVINGQVPKFALTATKMFGLVIILSTQYNAKLLHQQKSGLKQRCNWNKNHSKTTIQAQNQ